MGATLGCEQRHWGMYLQWPSEHAQENSTQTQLPVFLRGQLPFVPQYFASKLLVVPEQCFTHGSLTAASSLLLSFAVARHLAQGLLGRRVQLTRAYQESGKREEIDRGFCFLVPQQGNAPSSCLVADGAFNLKQGFTSKWKRMAQEACPGAEDVCDTQIPALQAKLISSLHAN